MKMIEKWENLMVDYDIVSNIPFVRKGKSYVKDL
jgi:hypothetical protein